MTRKGINQTALRFAKVCITICLPFIIVYFATTAAFRAAWFEVRATWGEYRAAMRRTEIDL